MSDLIGRQDVIDAALTFLVEYCGAAFDEDMQKMLCERLDNIPSAEPERKKGKWIVVNSKPAFFWLRCSECGYGNNTKTNYCPNCGARLEWK